MKYPSFSYFLNWVLLGLILGFVVLIFQGHIQLDIINHNQPTRHDKIPTLSYSEAVALAAPSVVYIKALTYDDAPNNNSTRLIDRLFGKNLPLRSKSITSTGSGVILDSEGYILTNYHVIQGADEIELTLYDGQVLIAELVGKDIETDLAVLKIDVETVPKIKTAEMMSSKIGDIVLAIGYPYAIGLTVTQGIISATGRTRVSSNIIENYIQTDAAINQGNSGGALINTSGEIIGINSLIYTKTGSFQGIGFAIPIDIALDVLEQIKSNGHVARGWIGIQGGIVGIFQRNQSNLTTSKGIYISSIDPNGPADKGGLQAKDVITHINKQAISTILEFRRAVAGGVPGDVLEISGFRNRQSFMVDVILGKRPMVSQ